MSRVLWPIFTCFILTFSAGAARAQSQTFDGTWASTSADSRGVIRLVIRGPEIRAFWVCRPVCDLGVAVGEMYPSTANTTLLARFSQGFADIVVIVTRKSADELRVDSYAHFTDGSGRENTSESQIFRRLDGRGEDFQAFPQFPWPPPKWTSRYLLPDGLVTTGQMQTLGYFFDRVRDALRRAQVDEWSSYAIGEDGFVIVSRLESIQDSGSPSPGPARWNTDRLPATIDGLKAYLSALFTARTGRYRVIALVVTPRSVVAGAEAPGVQGMASLLRMGATALPDSFRNRTVPSVRCEALIYEFFKASEDDSIKLVEASRLQPTDHLVGAGLWKMEDLRR
jgi:hypothetical protein